MKRICVIDLPGLSRDLLKFVPSASALGRWISSQPVAQLAPSLPAVTCSVQATLTTGTPPARHGIIANGLPTFRSPADQGLVDDSNFAEYRKHISFWEQSNQFLGGPRFWQNEDGTGRWKTALLFFQNCMPGFHGTPRPAADIVLTPKPDHGPDGKIVSLCWSQPRELVPALFAKLGPFPLMNYWGPMANIKSSAWIAQAAAMIWREHRPQLQLTYVPHLDYDLQRFGPDSPQAAKAVEDVAVALEPLVAAVLDDGADLIVLSEYAIRPVKGPIAINCLLCEAGLLATRPHADGTLVDYAATPAFAMCDHQVAHIYTRDAAATAAVRELLGSRVGMTLWGRQEMADQGLNHSRSGDLLAFSADHWFDYRWWTDPAQAPVFAATVDIHRKPGYDPLELFFDPATRAITQNAALVKGSHGSPPADEAVLIGAGATGTVRAQDLAAIVSQKLL